MESPGLLVTAWPTTRCKVLMHAHKNRHIRHMGMLCSLKPKQKLRSFAWSPYFFAILSEIWFGILHDILSGILFATHFDILSGIFWQSICRIFIHILTFYLTSFLAFYLPHILTFYHSPIVSFYLFFFFIRTFDLALDYIYNLSGFLSGMCSGPGVPSCIQSSPYGLRGQAGDE